jgi:hypothetical protein
MYPTESPFTNLSAQLELTRIDFKVVCRFAAAWLLLNHPKNVLAILHCPAISFKEIKTICQIQILNQ